jgi:16S rRNA (cytosine1402-N4)-methyltransferase
LVNAVSSVVPEFAKKGRRMGRTATLARVFQSLRIVVNQEDEALVDVFEHAAPNLVRPGGRLVVLSYHSMEDRATKRVLRDGSVRGSRAGAIERDIYGNVVGQERPWKPLGKKRKASDKEVEANSRARSATLRIGERQ